MGNVALRHVITTDRHWLLALDRIHRRAKSGSNEQRRVNDLIIGIQWRLQGQNAGLARWGSWEGQSAPSLIAKGFGEHSKLPSGAPAT